MSATLKIESDESVRIASELASLAGEPLAAAVEIALRERLERARKLANESAWLQRVQEMSAEMRAILGEPLPGSDHGFLYGEDGLPK